MEPAIEFGDRLVIDLSNNRPSPSGVFLIWNGVSVALAKVTVYPSNDPKKPPKVSYGASAETQEVPVANLNILGRVKGVWKRA